MRIRVRFTIRELLLMTAIVGVLLGWWRDRQQMAQYREKVSLVMAHSRNIPLYLVPRTIEEYHAELVQRGFKPMLEEEELSASLPQEHGANSPQP